jgi:Cu(I)/Ag(I) efflux system membrane protein CusA/SilA
MVPIAIPTFGGMVIQLMTMYVVPVFQAIWRENAIKKQAKALNYEKEL